MPTLTRPRLRLEQAKTHKARFAETWNAFLDSDDPYDVFVNVDDEGNGEIRVYESEEAPTDQLSLEFGELLYQLRAALDSLVYELAILNSGSDPPPDADKLEFPIRESQSAFDSVAWKIAPLSDLHRWMIGQIQPYVVPKGKDATRLVGQTLQLLNDWARKDRHRSLHVVTSWAANKQPIFFPPDGCHVDSIIVSPDGPLEQNHVVATFRVVGWERGLEFEANPNLTIDVSLDEPLPALDVKMDWLRGEDDTLDIRARALIVSVATVIDTFEKTLD